VLELIDRDLELLVEHAAVGDHDGGVEDRPLVGGVKGREVVGEPGDRVALARAGRVLDEVVVPGPVLAGMSDELAGRVELVVAREDEVLRSEGLPVDHSLGSLQVHEAFEDVEPAVALEHLLPEIGGAMTAGIGRVARARVSGWSADAAVEGQELGLAAGEAGGHLDRIRIDGEMDDRA